MTDAAIEQRLNRLMQVALGMDQFGHVYRNHYCAKDGSDDASHFEALVNAGLAERGRQVNGHTYYHVTYAAAKSFGVPKREFNHADKVRG